MNHEADIIAMGREGEGLAAYAGGKAYVPFTLAGERAEIAAPQNGQSALVAVKRASAERQSPVCRYFGACGGCLLQHWQAEPYQAWKRSLVAEAFARRGITAAEGLLPPLFAVPAGARRRLVLSGAWEKGALRIGFNRFRSHEIIAVEQCPVALPVLAGALPVLRRLLGGLRARRQAFHSVLTAAENGLDMALEGLGGLNEAEKLRLAASARAAGAAGAAGEGEGGAQADALIRLTADGEIIWEAAKPVALFGSVPVELPPGGFLQASGAAEAHMAAIAVAALAKCKNVADLFCGCGSFAFRLAARSTVYAAEHDTAAVAGLRRAAADAARVQAAGAGAGLKKITAEQRDLFRRPLTAKELAAFDGLVFDPPRAGAEAQAREIAKADLRVVVAVSCNPQSLARDVEILLGGGYRLESLEAIDQFIWSPHVEAVAVLRKPRAKKGWVL